MHLITDRTEEDALLGRRKGRYTVEDINRVEAAVQLLCSQAKPLDINLNLTVKTDWTLPGNFSKDAWPTESHMARYLENVRAMCKGLDLQVSLPSTMHNLTTEGANSIERALLKVHERITSVLQTYQYSGEFCAGEENVL